MGWDRLSLSGMWPKMRSGHWKKPRSRLFRCAAGQLRDSEINLLLGDVASGDTGSNSAAAEEADEGHALMIPKECKRLAEVDFPIAEVSRHAAREKSIRHGHPSTLHLWWARRPLASSRAVLLALLWPDPCDPLCPEDSRRRRGSCCRRSRAGRARRTRTPQGAAQVHRDFANWDQAAQRTYLEVSRALVKAAHGEEPPLVVDPFAGGGSIPLEALRLGCEAFASDLNPVA